jgi:hypothetical protein
MRRITSGLFAGLLVASGAVSDTPPEDWPIGSRFAAFETIVLVRVVESTFPAAIHSGVDVSQDASATVLVLKSWKGPFQTGRSLHVVPPGYCFGSSCLPYPLRPGEELLIFDGRTVDPIFALQSFVYRAADSKVSIAALDALAQERPQNGPNNRWSGP